MTIHMLHVTGDPEREQAVREMQLQQPSLCVHVDTDRKGVMWNWAQAVICATRDVTEWSIILQDDVRALEGWRGELNIALEHSPSPLLGLTSFGDHWKKAAENGYQYVVGPNVLYGAAIAYRRDIMKQVALFAQLAAQTGYKHDDMALCTWAEMEGFEPAVVTRAIFTLIGARSTLGHAPYRRPESTIHSHKPNWAGEIKAKPSRKFAKRTDAGVLAAELERLES